MNTTSLDMIIVLFTTFCVYMIYLFAPSLPFCSSIEALPIHFLMPALMFLPRRLKFMPTSLRVEFRSRTILPTRSEAHAAVARHVSPAILRCRLVAHDDLCPTRATATPLLCLPPKPTGRTHTQPHRRQQPSFAISTTWLTRSTCTAGYGHLPSSTRRSCQLLLQQNQRTKVATPRSRAHISPHDRLVSCTLWYIPRQHGPFADTHPTVLV